MKILFDQNTPRGLARHLAGHQVSRARKLGWEELKNGVLPKAAEDDGFDLLLTCDRYIVYQQSLAGRKIAVLELSTNNWNLVKPYVATIAAAVDEVRPGTYGKVECGAFVARKFKRPSGPAF